MTDQNNAAPDLGTSSGGRAYIAEYFATQLRRHDFARYINSTLAADFACVLAQHLSKLRAEGVPKPVLGYPTDAVADATIKAAYEKVFGTTAGWEDYAGSYFVEGYQAALASAPVAGEAIYQIKLPGDKESGWHDATEGAYWTATEKTRRIVFVAPQASEPQPTDERFKPPFDNCSFRMCDLPGQCRGEGKCHHPAPQASEAAPFSPDWANYRQGLEDGKAEASEAVPKPIAVARHSDQSVLLAFSSCRLASVFERTIQPQIDRAHKDLIAHGVSIQRIEPADVLALQADKDGGDCAKGAGDVLSNLIWAASERDKGNRIRQFDQFMDEARAAISATGAERGQRNE